MNEAIEALPVYTIGHSTRPFDEFVALLASAGVRQLVDVRRFPGSRTNPQYNREHLSEALPDRQVRYVVIPELGGRRPGQDKVPPDVNGRWRNRSFHNYADYAMTGEFAEGLQQLLFLAEEKPCAIMCSEAVWWRCHRRIIADYLLLEGKTVLHIMGGGRVDEATMTPGSVPTGNRLSYPAD